MIEIERLTLTERLLRPRFTFVEVIGIAGVLMVLTWFATANYHESEALGLIYTSALREDTIEATRERIDELPRTQEVRFNNLLLDAEKVSKRRVPQPSVSQPMMDRLLHGADPVYIERLSRYINQRRIED